MSHDRKCSNPRLALDAGTPRGPPLANKSMWLATFGRNMGGLPERARYSYFLTVAHPIRWFIIMVGSALNVRVFKPSKEIDYSGSNSVRIAVVDGMGASADFA